MAHSLTRMVHVYLCTSRNIGLPVRCFWAFRTPNAHTRNGPTKTEHRPQQRTNVPRVSNPRINPDRYHILPTPYLIYYTFITLPSLTTRTTSTLLLSSHQSPRPPRPHGSPRCLNWHGRQALRPAHAASKPHTVLQGTGGLGSLARTGLDWRTESGSGLEWTGGPSLTWG